MSERLMLALLSPIRWLFFSVGSLTQRTARAGAWMVIGDGANRVTSLVRLVILARLLSPADFGLMGIALVVTKWAEYFTELGFKDALIQKPGDIRPYLNTVWTAQILRGLCIAIALVTVAPVAGWFFNEHAAILIIQVLALESIARGLVNPAITFLRKELDFRREAMWRISSAAAGLVISIPLAFLLRNVWALVFAVVAASVVETITSYWVEPYRPRLSLNWQHIRELRSFGRWVFWIRAIGFLGSSVDSLAIGKLLGSSALGFYQTAHQLGFVPTSTLGVHTHGVMFPAYSKIEGRQELRSAVVRTLGVVSSVMLPVGCLFVVFGDQIVRVALGARWLSVVPILAILAWAGIAQTHSFVLSALLMASARPNLETRVGFVKVFILIVSLYPAVTIWGPTGVAITVVGSTAVSVVYQFVVVRRVVHLTLSDVGRAAKAGLLGSIPFVLSWFMVSPGLSLSALIIAAVAVPASLVIVARPLQLHLVGRRQLERVVALRGED